MADQDPLRATACAILLLLACAPVTAADPFADCAARIEADSHGRMAARCFHDAAVATGEWAAAADHLELAVRRHPASGWLHYYLGEVVARTSGAAAAAHYRTAADRFAAAGDAAGEAEARIDRGVALAQAGDTSGAWIEADRAIEAARASQDVRVLVRALSLDGWLALQTGERLARAVRSLHEAEQLVFPAGPSDLRLRVLVDFGNLSFAIGRHARALDYYALAADLARDQEDVEYLAMSRFNMLVAQRSQMEALPDLSRRAEFMETARELLALTEASVEPGPRAGAHRALGDLMVASDMPAAAETHYRAALAYAQQTGDAGQLSESLWALGRFLAGTHAEEAESLLDDALRAAVDSGSPTSVAYAWRERMRLAWKTLPRDGAVAESLQALDAIETIRALQGTDGARAGAFSAWTLDYYWLVGALLDGMAPSRSDAALAFEVAERMRARLLLEALLRQPPASSGEQEALEERRQILLRALSDAQRRLLDPHLDEASRAAIVADLERLERAEEDARAAIVARATLPDEPPAFASLDEIEEALSPDEALLAFSIGIGENFYGESGGGGWLLAISNAGTHVVRVPDRVRLHHMVSVFRGLSEHGDRIDPRSSASAYDALLREAFTRLPAQVTRLIIVPDGPLHALPFAALRPEAGAPPLGETHEIAVVPSASVWLHLRRQPPRFESGAALIVADPQLPDTIRGAAAADERGWWPAVARLGPLPHARTEGRAVRTHIGGDSRLLIGRNATETAVKHTDLAAYRLLHFAAHALVDEEYPERSAIFLAAGDDGDDGLLQAREIADLPLDGHIIVLSACRSATGPILAGEGVMGLARAFLEAGAVTVVGTLWNIRDDHAAQFFDGFYDGLSRGQTVGAALAHARRLAIDQGLPAFAWSSVVAIGDDTVVLGTPAAGTHGWQAGVLGFALLVLIAIVLIRMRRQRAHAA